MNIQFWASDRYSYLSLMKIIETLNPTTFTEHEQYVPFSIISQDERFGIIDGSGHVVCPCICEFIKFGMPSCIARVQYKGLEFIVDRHSNWGTFLFFWEEWGIPIDFSIPFVLVVASFDLFLFHNRRLSCDMSEEDMKVIYDEFTQIVKEHNSIIKREHVLSMTDNHEVKEYIDKSASLLTKVLT